MEEPEGQGGQLPTQILAKSCKDFSQPLHIDCSVEYNFRQSVQNSQKIKPILTKDLLLLIAPSDFHTLRRPGT